MKKELEATADKNGQVTFAAAVFHDDELSVEQKEYWLKEIGYSSTGEVRADAVMYLMRLTEPLESEFIRG